ncbi:ROK family protein [Carnobacteriaceae bacterium 52-44]
MTLLTLDMGGTFIKYGFWKEETLQNVNKFPTPSTLAHFKKAIKAIIKSSNENIQGLAISAPGVVDQEAGMIKGISAIPYIHGFKICEDFEKSFSLPVYIENDANCAGICEMTYGVGKSSQNVAFVVIGTGVGGSLFINGELYKGTHNFAGEFGLIETKDGPLSYSASIVKASNRYNELTNEQIDGEELFERKAKGDELANELIKSFYDNLSEFMYNLQVTLNLDLVSIGGGVSAQKEISEVLENRLKSQLTKNNLGAFMPSIKTNQFANNANLIGAATIFIKRKV